MRRSLIACIVLAGSAAVAAESDTADPYVVTIDLRPWIEDLRSDDLFETDPAIEKLGALGDAAVPALHAALRSEGPQARLNIVEILRDIRTPATAPPLIDAAADADEEVRADALAALGRLGDRRGRPAVEAALMDASPKIARAAAMACNSLCASPAALRKLVEMALAERTSGFARPSLRAIGEGDGAEQVRVLVDELAVPAMQNGTPEQRYHAAMVVADTGNPAAVPVLCECIEKAASPPPNQLPMLCAQALGDSGSPQALAALIEMAHGDDRALRPVACAALGALVHKDPTARAAYVGCAQQAAAPK